MVHASLRAIGEVAGGPDKCISPSRTSSRHDGTMFMYASCPAYVDEVGRGNLTPEQEAEVLEKLPPFDPYTARSARDNGALVELSANVSRLARERARRAIRRVGQAHATT